MSGLSFNKIAGAILATAFTIAVLSVGVPMLFERTPPVHPGYLIATPPEGAGGAAEAPDVPPDWGSVLPTADVAAGEAKTAACKSCHSFDPAGTNGAVGPGLFGVVGRKPGSHAGFAYSPAMIAFSAKTPVWDYDHLYDFLKGPQAYISGTKMTFVGLKAPQDRINVIAYLHSLGSNLPVPAPHPKPAPAVAAAPGKGTAATASATPPGATGRPAGAPSQPQPPTSQPQAKTGAPPNGGPKPS
jgi:cytochrome c